MAEQPRSHPSDTPIQSAALRNRLRELEITVESLADLVVIVDDESCVVDCNGAAERIWGLSPSAVVGRPMPTASGLLEVIDRDGNVIPPDAVPTMRAIQTGLPQRVPVLGVRRPGGSIRWAQVVAVPVTPGARVVSVWTDITAAIDHQTDLARMNQELERRVGERTVELQATIAELEAFSYSVSHDLRSPVRTISLLAESLRAEIDSGLHAGASELVDRIHLAAEHMDGLIDVLLEFSTAARAEPRRRPLDISAMARDQLQRLADRYPDRRIECVVPDGIAGDGDEQLIAIVLHNLLSNAWKFTAHVEAPRVDVGVRASAGATCEQAYFVRDNGVGIDMAHAEDLFAPFRRLHSLPGVEGSGIGLAIVHRIITRHGGRVWAESEPGNGATFYFTLPTTT